MKCCPLLSLLVLASCGSTPNATPETTVELRTQVPESQNLQVQEVAATPALLFEVQEGWIEEVPESKARKLQCVLPGDAAAGAHLVVYYFGEGGGTVEANIERWASQFEQPDGGPSMKVLRRSERRVAQLVVHEVELSGTYVAETAPGSGVRVREEDWAMKAAIVESDHGPYYAKLVGPRKTLERWASSYRNFISSVHAR